MHINKISKCFIAISLAFIVFSCQTKSNPDTEGKKIVLLKYGIPHSLLAPSDVQISKIGKGELIDVSVKNEKGYDLQIFMVEAFTSNIQKIKDEKKSNVTSNPSFSKMVEEYDDGFLYEKITDQGKRTYDFNIIKIVGANEINFQCGNSKEFTESEVKKMVGSIRK